MCIFSGKVDHVGNTKIFGRNDNGNQYLVYSMSVQAQEDLAMVLPLPVHSEDAVKFINLEKYPNFFDDVEKCFYRPTKFLSRGIGVASFSVLQVHDVGDFIASFVPNRASFLKLDKRFKLPDTAWNSLPDYSDYGFAVFQLKADREVKNIHPMALQFPSKHVDKIFFPTVQQYICMMGQYMNMIILTMYCIGKVTR